jgi:hypothetical protein
MLALPATVPALTTSRSIALPATVLAQRLSLPPGIVLRACPRQLSKQVPLRRSRNLAVPSRWTWQNF